MSWIDQLTGLDYFVIAANVVLLIFAGVISKYLSRLSEDGAKRSRMIVLRTLSAGLLICYLIGMGFDSAFCSSFEPDCRPFQRLAKTGLTLLGGYVVYMIIHAVIVRRYGRKREVDGQTINYQSYQSELLSILTLSVVIIIAAMTLLSIWGVEDDLLKSTSTLGAIALIVFFTKDIWLPDVIHGLILLYKSDIEPGSVVRIPALDLCGVALRTTLLETTFRDLVTRHQISVPNRLIRQHRLDILSKAGSSGLPEHIDFNIGYTVSTDEVESLLKAVWEQACEAEGAINREVEPKVRVADNGDHAIVWRLFYTVKNVYRINPARYAIHRAAHELSTERGIGLNTPLTHEVLKAAD